jgi:hypothetical protein
MDKVQSEDYDQLKINTTIDDDSTYLDSPEIVKEAEI